MIERSSIATSVPVCSSILGPLRVNCCYIPRNKSSWWHPVARPPAIWICRRHNSEILRAMCSMVRCKAFCPSQSICGTESFSLEQELAAHKCVLIKLLILLQSNIHFALSQLSFTVHGDVLNTT